MRRLQGDVSRLEAVARAAGERAAAAESQQHGKAEAIAGLQAELSALRERCVCWGGGSRGSSTMLGGRVQGGGR